ncbi:glycoside hydrolase family 7 protein [Patellaria atrata CBS 101060]|uniref:Glucanase n=1 Tax=Patellaria atrata CBS 101060 TaxID=1346257 RepID=A0A9P4SIH4_9PEZI|nr:glycoside hydrolase family 7 protein [Patellaria atrata CBS 101060]
MTTMAPALVFLTSLLFGFATAQKPGPTREVHPKIDTWKCTKRGGCVKQNNAIVLDSLAHPVYQKDNPSLGCGSWGQAPNATVCPDEASCAENCIMDGIMDYTQYGVKTSGSSLYLRQIKEDGSVVSPRVYLLAPNEQKYEMLKLTGKELTFDVDASKLPCGMNGALYLSEMAADGAKSSLNKGGAYYGTGYCDAQCFTTPFINGVGNIEGKGSCCNEMDIWEANSRSTHLAPHPCNQTGLYECTGEECAFEGVCDKNGCGYNPYRVNQTQYYGRDGLKVDTKKPFTVVTQFPQKNGKLVAIKRLYIQDGKLIQNAMINVEGLPKQDYLEDNFCELTGSRRYMDLGATAGMGAALSRGMVLAFSVWWDEGGFMKWLDSGEAGPCTDTEGDPAVIKESQPDTSVTFSQIKWGDIDSTYKVSGRS